MNRIILVGNGFDLAHGLPTNYADFINWYWGQWGNQLLRTHDKTVSDRFCSFGLKEDSGLPYISFAWSGCYYIKDNPIQPWDVYHVVNMAKNDKKIFSYSIKDRFFEEICHSVETKGWVDIENIFYDYLSHKSECDIAAKTVNDDLEVIRKYLIEYLSRVQLGVKRDLVNEELKNKITEPFVANNISLDWLNDAEFKTRIAKAKSKTMGNIPDRILALNFNYTDFADRYFSDIPNTTVIHIHGSLAKPDSVIFGYGDELDQNYKEILNKNDNEYLRHIKSIRYFESSNYRSLLEFIESNPYQIYIMGHSCGISDRTLLNTLFEHRNCASIKPFYHKKEDGSDNYIELAQNITRNFTDMKLLRARVVNKDYCESLPQNNQVQFRLY